jgi:CheY-like chemotaxis protein/HPt (histidine-containing phosphotransfer) domain-containing protein
MACILVVDDRFLNRHFLLSLLGYGGHRLLEAANGAAALEIVRAERPDLVITDVLMPHMDGYEFVARLRAEPAIAGTPVIFYTATFRERDTKAQADASGVTWVLAKPSEPEAILHMVQQALGLSSDATPLTSGTADATEKQILTLTDQLGDEVKDLDVGAALRRFGGNLPVYLRALHSFVADARAIDQQLPERVSADVSAGQRDHVHRSLHTLKGLAATIGATPLANLAAQAQAGDLAELAALLPQVKSATLQAVDAAKMLAARLKEISKPEMSKPPGGAVSVSDAPPLRVELQALASLLKEANMDALTVCEQIMQRRPANAMPTEFEILAQAVNRLDFQTALRVCDDILQQPLHQPQW